MAMVIMGRGLILVLFVIAPQISDWRTVHEKLSLCTCTFLDGNLSVGETKFDVDPDHQSS